MQYKDTMPPGVSFGTDGARETTSIGSEGAELLSALFRDAPDDQLLEFQIIAQGGAVLEQQYHQIGELRTNGFDTAIPTNYDGRANVYYGVCPRIRRRGTRDDVELATAVWFDEITRAAPELPPFSWLVETSIGKVQGGYFLKEPSS